MILTRPLVILDLETTGTWIDKDRIIEVGMVRCSPDGTKKTYVKKVNPGMSIPSFVTAITGISDEDVKDALYFRQVSKEILAFLEGADFGGFNVERFDLPLLAREFSEVGICFNWQERTIYDAQTIYHLNEKRDLTSAYTFYCNKELINAHSALADTEATLDVLAAQVEKYGGGSLEALKEFKYKTNSEFYDEGRRLRWWNGELYMMFGKYARKNSLKEISQKDKGYLEWILSQNFNADVKEVVAGALEGHFPTYIPPSE